MDWDAVIKLFQGIGFPALVALWFMFRLERKLDKWIDLELAERSVLTEIRDELRRARSV